MQLVASEQKVMSGSVESMQNSDETDKDLIHYMVSSVMSLPMQEEDRKVKFLSQTNLKETFTRHTSGVVSINCVCDRN